MVSKISNHSLGYDMKLYKILSPIIASALLNSPAMAYDTHTRHTISLGYQGGNIKDYGNVQGYNFKFQYETSAKWGVLGSIALLENTQHGEYSRCEFYHKICSMRKSKKIIEEYKLEHRLDRNAEYYSVLIGPSYRINERFSVFAMAGMSHTKVDNSLRFGPDHKSKEKNGSESSNQFAYAAGVKFDVTEKVVIAIGYEGSQAAFNKEKHPMSSGFLNVGYRF